MSRQSKARDRHTKIHPVVVGALVLVFGLGCARALEETRRHTYAPNFNYISDAELQSTMWQLANGVATLERILSPDRVVTEQDRMDVIRILDRMDVAAADLGPEGWPSNHPRVTLYQGRFREQLARAKRAAQLDPPSYYLAGNISGACLACHGGPE